MARILVVDDDERLRWLLARMLVEDGHEVETASDGAAGLAAVAARAPDLIVLDLVMPVLGGIDVTRRLKAGSARAIPIVIVTAISEPDEQVRCLDAGADDFVVKPVRREVLLARVRTQLRLKRLRDDLEAGQETLERQSHRLKAVAQMRDDLVQMLVHDLKGPLTALGINLELLHAIEGARLDDAGMTTLNNMNECTGVLRSMVQNILEVTRLEEARVELQPIRFRFADLVVATVSWYGGLARQSGSRIVTAIPADLPECIADMNLVSRVVENLLLNAVRFSDEGSDIRVEAEADPAGGLVVSVADRGPGIPAEQRELVFEKYRTEGASGHNQGLGLTFCKLAVEAHGGRVWVEDREGGGCRFRFRLPTTVAVPTGPALCTAGALA